MIDSICVITPGYPSKEKPYAYTFVDQLVCAIADKGVEVSVVTPYDMLKAKSTGDRFWERDTLSGNKVKVYSPGALALTTRKIGPINFSLLSERLFRRAVQRTIKKNQIHSDVLYAHFLFPAGICAVDIGGRMKLPSVCAFGESSLWSIREIGLDRARKQLDKLTGMVAVSTNNKNVLIKNRLVAPEKITVIPNAVNKEIFCPGDKKAARVKLGLPLDRFIGIYNGAFTKAKGSLRVEEAARGIDSLSMVYLGGGQDEPQGGNILFKGRVAHEDVPVWLQAADFFVLPTLEEGCCNAVVEAMSVGLPVITSDKPFNYDILDQESAHLVDPMNVEEIHVAMQELAGSEVQRKKLSEASLRRSADLDIKIRAEKVLDFLKSAKQNYQGGKDGRIHFV